MSKTRAGKSAPAAAKSARSVPAAKPASKEQREAGALATRIRATRRQKDVTLGWLAQATELDKGYLSRVERGQKTPSISTLMRIAQALGVQLGHLFGEAVAADAITVVRRDERQKTSAKTSARARSGLSIETVLPPAPRRRLSAFLLEPAAPSGGEPEAADHGGDEMIFVMEGSVEVVFADRSVTLEAGDCAHFDGHVKHKIHPLKKRPAKVLVIMAQDLQDT